MNKAVELAEAQRLAHIGSWYWDAGTGEYTSSEEMCRIFGLKVIPPFAEQCETLYTAETWQKLNAAFQEAVRIGTPYMLILPALRQDGTELWVIARGEPVCNADGKVIGLRGTVQDITGHQQTRIALYASKQLLDFSMHLSHMGGWDLNLSDHTVNRTQEHDRIFGYEAPLPEWNYDIFLGHVLAEDRAEVDRSFRESLAAQTDWNFECRIRRTDGEVRWIWVAGRHQRNDLDEVRRMSGIVQDITEHRHLEQALQEKNAALENARLVAEQASLAKSNFLSSMSHELRTPLNAILGFAQLLEAGSPPLQDIQVARLQQINKAGWYLLELINEILDLAMIESGKASFSRESVPLAETMLECRSMVESQAQARGVRIDFLPFDVTWYAQADRVRVKQVIVNLLTNAIKYNRAQGTVEVKCTCTADRIRVNIKDSGMGLSAELQKQLFQPFNRLGQEGGSEEGTGIGLVVAKQLVELMGGSMGVTSTVGVGSEFWIELIRGVAPQLAAGNIIPVNFTRHTQENTVLRTVLYVEDNPANLMLVEQLIADQPGLRMLGARDGNLGIALARTHLPDVILMDISLPGISGIEAMNILRQDPATAHIPIVALSANAMLYDRELGLQAGFTRYLTKPIKFNEFLATLDEVLELSKRKPINTHETGQIS